MYARIHYVFLHLSDADINEAKYELSFQCHQVSGFTLSQRMFRADPPAVYSDESGHILSLALNSRRSQDV